MLFVLSSYACFFQRNIVRALSTFVAVIDETDSHFSYENLEKLLQSVGQRWMSVCEWAEMRARQLDGLSELIARYTSAYRKILEWLDNWEAVSLKESISFFRYTYIFS
ncbi:unnamed protein product [Onchocerca flexuosa]|uniref:DHC_N1 domain-containing protein n=1 Tax=Onchocerca flexuosa TaxID=387005 RepID=A0A183HLH2_9BILA|nr:unnamed protein product [Onchocerca flexuosa]